MDDYDKTARGVIEQHQLAQGDFLEIRYFIGEQTNINIRNNAAEQVSNEVKIGAAIRALVSGAWGFSTSKSFKKRDLSAAIEMSIGAAKASINGLVEKSAIPSDYIYQGNAPLKSRSIPVPFHSKRKFA